MGTSFVLRDSSGALRGYLVRGMGKLRCRTDNLAAEGQLVLLFTDGGTARYALAADGAEQTLTDGGREITGAAVCVGDAPLLYTDEQAYAACARLLRRETAAEPDAPVRQSGSGQEEEQMKKEEKKEEQEKKEEPNEQDEEPPHARSAQQAEPAGCEAGSTERLPQRRWPPPACWPEAQYVHGRWQEE